MKKKITVTFDDKGLLTIITHELSEDGRFVATQLMEKKYQYVQGFWFGDDRHMLSTAEEEQIKAIVRFASGTIDK